MASKKYASCRPANTHHLGERCDRGGGLLEGRSVGTESWHDDGVSYIPDCGVLAEGPHCVGVFLCVVVWSRMYNAIRKKERGLCTQSMDSESWPETPDPNPHQTSAPTPHQSIPRSPKLMKTPIRNIRFQPLSTPRSLETDTSIEQFTSILYHKNTNLIQATRNALPLLDTIHLGS